MPEIKLGQRTIPYSIRESARARRLSLKIDPQHGLQVILPVGANPGAALEGLLREKSGWILRHLQQLEAAQPPQRRYTTGETIPFLGDPLTLELIPTQHGKRTSVARQANLLRVRLQGGIMPGEEPMRVREALEGWYRQQAKRHLVARVAHFATVHGFRYEKITIKGQQSRWGSCSSQKNLNFNWRLMMAPPGAVDYVVIHELCHLRELNHSPRFWALVAHYCPDYPQWIAWFKAHQAQLFW